MLARATAKSRDRVTQKYQSEIDSAGTVKLSKEEVEILFDAKARELVGMTGSQALKKIRSGKVNGEGKWTTLILMSGLL